MSNAARKPVVVRPVIDLDLDRAHQYGYRRPRTNSIRIGGEQPELPADQTRTPEEVPTWDQPTA